MQFFYWKFATQSYKVSQWQLQKNGFKQEKWKPRLTFYTRFAQIGFKEARPRINGFKIILTMNYTYLPWVKYLKVLFF